jgi:hypothetical protein
VAQAGRFEELGNGAPERAALRHAGPQAFPSHKTPCVSNWGASEGLGGAWEVHPRRGFVEAAVVEAVTGDDLARAAARHPIVSISIRGPSFLQPPRAPRALLGSPWVARLRSLALHDFTREEDVGGALAGAPLSRLEALTLRDCKLDNAAARTLSASELPALERMVSVGHNFRASGLGSLLDRFGASLRVLCIEDHSGIDDAWIRTLTKAPLPKLTHLFLGGGEKNFAFSAGMVAALCEATNLSGAQVILLANTLAGTRANAEAQLLLSRRFPPAEVADVDVSVDDGLVVSCALTNSWSTDRAFAPPSILLSQGYDLRTIVGVTNMLLDGALRNDFDVFTFAPGETRRVALRVPPEASSRVPAGRAQFLAGGASTWVELPDR